MDFGRNGRLRAIFFAFRRIYKTCTNSAMSEFQSRSLCYVTIIADLYIPMVLATTYEKAQIANNSKQFRIWTILLSQIQLELCCRSVRIGFYNMRLLPLCFRVEMCNFNEMKAYNMLFQMDRIISLQYFISLHHKFVQVCFHANIESEFVFWRQIASA